MHIVDLAITLEGDLPSDPPVMIPKVEYHDHLSGASEMAAMYGCTRSDLPLGLGWATESLTLTTHSGTHLDAPWHYHPTTNRGEPAATIDQLPLEWCFSDGVRLDFRDKEDGYRITAKDLDERLARLRYTLKAYDIVLICTGADQWWGTSEYLVKGCGMSREATLWLLDRGVKITGIDAWSWDRPLPLVAREFAASGDSGLIWEAHFTGIDRAFYHMEKMTNLSVLPSLGFRVACFPIKIRSGSAGWVRPVAIFE